LKGSPGSFFRISGSKIAVFKNCPSPETRILDPAVDGVRAEMLFRCRNKKSVARQQQHRRIAARLKHYRSAVDQYCRSRSGITGGLRDYGITVTVHSISCHSSTTEVDCTVTAIPAGEAN
jgi:hypothetical protein